MKQFWDKTKKQAVLYKLAIAFLVFYSLDSIATSIVSVMIDTKWSDLDGTQQFIRICLVIKSWAAVMLAFFTNASKKIQNNELPFGDDDNGVKQHEKSSNASGLPFNG